MTASEAVRDADGRIVTDFVVLVREPLKGPAKPGDFVTLRSLGGAIGNLAMTVPGAPHVSVGERAVFFLRPSFVGNDQRFLRAVGMAQGVMRLKPSARGVYPSDPLVLPGGAGLELLRRGPDGQWQPGQPALATPLSLGALKEKVQGIHRRRQPGAASP